MPSRILLVDDHDVARMGVRSLLAGDPRWEVCGEAMDGQQAIEKVRELGPDIVLLDLCMPAMNGFEAAAAIRRLAPSTKIIFLSMHEIPTIAKEVGADGFVSKSAAKELPAVLERILMRDRGAHA
jgi:DNA-binding NarL/FixJ family response regulator